MKKSFIASVLGSTLVGAPALAEMSPVEMASLMRDQGCRVEVADLARLGEERGFTANDVQDAVFVLFELGASTVADDGALWLEPGYCGLTGSATVEQVLVAGLRLNGCRMTEDQAEVILAQMGLNETNTTPAVEALVGRGDAHLVDDRYLTLGASLCAGADIFVASTDTADVPAPNVSGETAQLLVEIAAANNCEIDEETAESVFPELGIEMSVAEDAAMAMVDAGQATFVADVFTVLPPHCAPGAAPQLESSDPVALRNPAWPAFQALFQDHDCGLAFEPASLLAGDYGLDLEAADELADQLMDAGLAEVGGDVLVLDAAVCTPSPESTANLLTLDLMMWLMMSDCENSLIELTQWIGDTGENSNDAQGVIWDMVEAGRLTQDGTTFLLEHPNCS